MHERLKYSIGSSSSLRQLETGSSINSNMLLNISFHFVVQAQAGNLFACVQKSQFQLNDQFLFSFFIFVFFFGGTKDMSRKSTQCQQNFSCCHDCLLPFFFIFFFFVSFLPFSIFNYLNPGIHLQFSGHCFVCYFVMAIFLFAIFVLLSRLIVLSIVMYCW